MEDEAESVTWNISVVKICGELCSVKLRGWSVELLDVQREIKEATGIRKTRQLLFVGTRPCLPRQLLRDVLSLPGGVVTLVESTHHLRCGSCGVRGRGLHPATERRVVEELALADLVLAAPGGAAESLRQ